MITVPAAGGTPRFPNRGAAVVRIGPLSVAMVFWEIVVFQVVDTDGAARLAVAKTVQHHPAVAVDDDHHVEGEGVENGVRQLLFGKGGVACLGELCKVVPLRPVRGDRIQAFYLVIDDRHGAPDLTPGFLVFKFAKTFQNNAVKHDQVAEQQPAQDHHQNSNYLGLDRHFSGL